MNDNLPDIAPGPVTKIPAALIQVEQSRAIEQVQAALVIAKKFPRDLIAVQANILESCKRISLAKQAMYQFPRGGQKVTGPSIRLAEVLAQQYGNLDFGVRELERRGTVSIAESYCWDMQTNTRQTKVFEVPHSIMLKDGKMKQLSDPRDIYELVANNGARRLRACILGIIPGDIVESAVEACKKTLAKGDGKPLMDRIKDMVAAFKELGITAEMLEGRLGHKLEATNAEEIVDLQGVYTAIKDGQAKRTDFFDLPNVGQTIIEAIHKANRAQPSPTPQPTPEVQPEPKPEPQPVAKKEEPKSVNDLPIMRMAKSEAELQAEASALLGVLDISPQDFEEDCKKKFRKSFASLKKIELIKAIESLESQTK